jgi:hypothetical protein
MCRSPRRRPSHQAVHTLGSPNESASQRAGPSCSAVSAFLLTGRLEAALNLDIITSHLPCRFFPFCHSPPMGVGADSSFADPIQRHRRAVRSRFCSPALATFGVVVTVPRNCISFFLIFPLTRRSNRCESPWPAQPGRREVAPSPN